MNAIINFFAYFIVVIIMAFVLIPVLLVAALALVAVGTAILAPIVHLLDRK